MLPLLDKLAGWYLDWRTDQAVKKLPPELHELKLHRAEMNTREWEIVMTSPAIVYLADQVADLLQQQNAKNYVQFDLMPRPDRNKPPIRVTVQWASGISPAEKAAKLADALRQLIPIAESAMQTNGDMGIYGDSLYGADPDFHLQVADEQSAVIAMAKSLL